MKWIFLLCGLLSGANLQAKANTFSKDRMETFYDVFLAEERAILEEASALNPSPGPAPVPPPNPPAPSFMAGYLPFVLVNNSTLPDSAVNLVITGDQPSDHLQFVFVSFNGSGVGTLSDVVVGQNSSTFSKTLADFPLTTEGNRVLYLPNIDSARVWLSMNQALSMPVISGGTSGLIVTPNFTNTSDPNYSINFDKFELAYLTTGTPISINATAVDFFSIPIYLYVSTATSVNSTTGLYQPRSYCMSHAHSILASVPTQAEWEGLFETQGSTILRLLSTGKAMTATPSLFNANYLQDAPTYGYDFIEAIWTGPTSFYRQHPLKLTLPITGNPTYTGTIHDDNTIHFSDGASGTIVFRAPSPPDYEPSTFTTSGQILSAEPLWSTETVVGSGVQASKLFEEAIVSGLVPTTNTLSNTYLQSNSASYYTINPNLSTKGQQTGPWYDVYSKAIHSLGSIYSFGFDEILWPDVAVTSDYSPTSTYVGVTIGSIN